MSYDLTDPSESIEDRFYRLVDRWKSDPEVMYSSSISEIIAHPDYQAIIAMGWKVVPLILCELTREPDHWFVALSTITGENPMSEDCRGNLRKMITCWLAWGKEHNLI